MKLLIYSYYFPPSIGGVETIVSSLAQGIAQRQPNSDSPRMYVTVVTETHAGKYDDSSLPFRVIRRPTFRQLVRLVLECNVLHIAGPALLPLVLGRTFLKPTVVEHHGYQAICPNGLLIHQPERSICPGHFQAGRYRKCVQCQSAEMFSLKSLLRVLEMLPRNLLCRRASTNIAITNHVLTRHNLPNSRCVYYGIEGTSFGLGTFPVSPERICFAFLGRFVPEKGIPVLLDAASILKQEGLNFKLQLIGDGPQREEVEKMLVARNLVDRVTITGYLSGVPLIDALSTVDAVIVPSVWEEAAGLAAIEPMMAGRLVIASAIGGLSEVVGEGGLLFPPGDSTALASHMKAVLLDPSLIGPLAEKGRVRASHLFDRRRMIEQHASVYAELSRRSASRS